MEQDETGQLKKEIARLNQIITVLLEQNEVLKEQIAVAKSRNPSETGFVAVVKSYDGNKIDSIADAKSRNPSEIDFVAVAKSYEGNETDFIADAKSRNPSEIDSIAVAKSYEGNKTDFIAVAKTGNGNPDAFAQLPGFVPPSDLNIIKLNQILKVSGFNKIRAEAIRNASLLIIHFYNKGSGRAKDLEKLTARSKFGLAKYIRSLKNRGLIERDGWQKYKVTAYAIQLMQRAKCEG